MESILCGWWGHAINHGLPTCGLLHEKKKIIILFNYWTFESLCYRKGGLGWVVYLFIYFFAELASLWDLRIFSSPDQGSWVLAVKT